MEVIVHNGIERCPQQCSQAKIKVWNELRYGLRKASVTGTDIHVICDHAIVCARLAKALKVGE